MLVTVLANMYVLTYLISPFFIFLILLKPTWKCNFGLDDKQSSLGKTCESGLWGLTVFCINMKCFLRFIVYKGVYSVGSQECTALSGVIFTAKWMYRCFAPSFSHTFWQGVVLQHCWQRHQSRCIREWNNGATGTALVPKVLLRINGVMYRISWFTNVTFLNAFVHEYFLNGFSQFLPLHLTQSDDCCLGIIICS